MIGGGPMSQPGSITFTGTPSVEDVMAALAKQSIFDLPSLARQLVESVQERAEAENEPEVIDLIVHDTYVFVHHQIP